MEGLFPEAKYNDDSFSPREVGAVMTYNRIVGAIRMRTVRAMPNVNCPGVTAAINRRKVMNSSGDIFDQYFVEECYGEADKTNEDTRTLHGARTRAQRVITHSWRRVVCLRV